MGYEPTTTTGERPQTHASDRAVTGTDIFIELRIINHQGDRHIWGYLSGVAKDSYPQLRNAVCLGEYFPMFR